MGCVRGADHPAPARRADRCRRHPGQMLHDAAANDDALAAIPNVGLSPGVAATVGRARHDLQPVLKWRQPFERWRDEHGQAAVGAGERDWPSYAELVTALDDARPALELASRAMEAFLHSSLSNHTPRGWVTLNSQVIHQGPQSAPRRDDVIQPDGTPGIFEYIDVRDAERIVALNALGEVALVEDDFYLQERRMVHLPGGGMGPRQG